MDASLRIAAIDAGSNAIRLVIARADSPSEITVLASERRPVRLGHNVFTRGRLDKKTLSKAVKAFRHFRELMDHSRVEQYRAVATSAAREARNRRVLTDRIWRKAGIRLEVIDNPEEARLVRGAVAFALGDKITPRLILDLGGGSLELNLMRSGNLERTLALPLGTVRLMETYGIEGALSVDEEEEIRAHVLALLREHLPHPPDLAEAVAVACGGNAEALADLAPGPRVRGFDTMNLRLLRERLGHILGLDVTRRMKAFRVRRDRAEVMGIAALVFATLGRYLNLRHLVVPRVGVREGVLRDFVRAHFRVTPVVAEDEFSKQLRTAVRGFARRLDYDARHTEHVRRLALALFDQLRPLHRMGAESRLLLEMGALLHDVGRFVHRQGHHRHGEYLVRNADLPALKGWRRDMVACLVRYHNANAEPDPHHKSYAALDADRRKQARLLAALLRLAEALDAEHHQSVTRLDVEFSRREVLVRAWRKNAALLPLLEAQRRAALFEKEFGMKLRLRRGHTRRKVA